MFVKGRRVDDGGLPDYHSALTLRMTPMVLSSICGISCFWSRALRVIFRALTLAALTSKAWASLKGTSAEACYPGFFMGLGVDCWAFVLFIRIVRVGCSAGERVVSSA